MNFHFVTKVLFLVCLAVLRCSGQGQGVQCRQFRCADNAMCVNGECICNPGYVGFGRFICVLVGRCPCASFGDPHIRMFDLGRTRSVLPCQFVFSGFVTATGCDVQVELVTKRLLNPLRPFRTFTMMLKVKVILDNTVVEFTLGPGGLTPAAPVGTAIVGVPDAVPGLDITVVPSSFNDFARALLPECGNTIIGFDPILMASIVGTPNTGLFPDEGLCGNCNGNPSDDNEFQGLPGVSAREADLAFSLRELSIEQSTPDGQRCTELRQVANGTFCTPPAQLANAVRCCGVFYDSPFASCLLANPTIPIDRDLLLTIMRDCFLNYCVTGNRAVAANFVPSLAATGCVPANYVCPP